VTRPLPEPEVSSEPWFDQGNGPRELWPQKKAFRELACGANG
jgi:hypothetical protein